MFLKKIVGEMGFEPMRLYRGYRCLPLHHLPVYPTTSVSLEWRGLCVILCSDAFKLMLFVNERSIN